MLSLLALACTDVEPQDSQIQVDSDSAPPVVDTEEPVDTAALADDAAGVEGVQARLHEDFGSLVYASWTQLEAGTMHVAWYVDAGEWKTSPAVEVAAGETAEQLLLGVPYGTVVTYYVVRTVDGVEHWSAPRTKETDPLPLDVLAPTVHVLDEAGVYGDGEYLFTSLNETTGGWTQGTYWAFIIDRKGRVVWARETESNKWTIYARVSLDGDDLMLDEATYWSDFGSGEGGRVVRLKIDGTEVGSVDMPGLHHAWVELPGEQYAYGQATDDHNEYLTLVDPAKKTSTPIWECGATWSSTYCQSNALWYYEAGDSFLYSFYTHDTIVEIERTTGAELHSWGRMSEWTFDPTTSQFDWQHGANYTDAGTLLTSSQLDEGSKDCVVREYTVNESANSLDEVWNFGTEDGIACNTAGEAHRLPNGNTLHNYGSNGRTREAMSDGTVVWDVEWDGERLQGRSIFLEDLYAFSP